MKSTRLIFLFALLYAHWISCSYGQALNGTPYINSWLGNTYGLPADHIPHTINNLYVSPSGKIATITSWDEGGHNAALYSSSGATLGFPVSSGTGGWGRNSGEAIFVDDSYLYQVMSQNGRDGADRNPDHYPQDTVTVWQCVRRYSHDGKAAPFTGGKGYDGSMLIVESASPGTMLTGVLVLNNELYAADPTAGNIKIYNASTMSSNLVRAITIGNNSGWFDINGAIRATLRSNGEYLIFAEENGYGKIMMYRWFPPRVTANAAHSTVSPATATTMADGAATQPITVQARDTNDLNMISGGATVAVIRRMVSTAMPVTAAAQVAN